MAERLLAFGIEIVCVLVVIGIIQLKEHIRYLRTDKIWKDNSFEWTFEDGCTGRIAKDSAEVVDGKIVWKH